MPKVAKIKPLSVRQLGNLFTRLKKPGVGGFIATSSVFFFIAVGRQIEGPLAAMRRLLASGFPVADTGDRGNF